jgi:anti-sigma B factor antagonist
MAEHSHQPPTPGVVTVSPDQEPMIVRVEHSVAGVILIRVKGSIDCVSAPELQRTLVDASRARQGLPAELLLELSGVTFLDDVGLDALLHLLDQPDAGPGTIELLAPSPSVVRLLHEANLDGESWARALHEEPEDHPPS